jgi:hypothetical protein
MDKSDVQRIEARLLAIDQKLDSMNDKLFVSVKEINAEHTVCSSSVKVKNASLQTQVVMLYTIVIGTVVAVINKYIGG